MRTLEKYQSQCHQHIDDLLSQIEAQKQEIWALEGNLREMERQWDSERRKNDETCKKAAKLN